VKPIAESGVDKLSRRFFYANIIDQFLISIGESLLLQNSIRSSLFEIFVPIQAISFE